VSRLVVLDRVIEGEDNSKPGDNETESTRLEPSACCSRDCLIQRLLFRVLELSELPTAWNNHEEVQPEPEIKPQWQPELDFSTAIVVAYDEGVGINKLPFLPGAPMTNSLPSQSNTTHTKQIPEEDVHSNRQFLQVVTIDVDANEETDKSSSGSEQCPIPLPATTNGIEARIAWCVNLSMLG
jgi:hypothetical protein